ncbi:MAG: AAA family ATPase [Desulfococcaceae bacterium]|jgi:hypothetical protein|nr:AAA family ATPase [Desulfococcaceae bacterium]
MKFPYGICDFREIVTKDYFYCDRTDRIPLLEKGKYLLFLRPRRFGKSLLLSMLSNYYDVAKAGEFDTLFGQLKIGKNPTPLHNRYFILQWDFSCVDPSGSVQDIRRSLYNHINTCIEDFLRYYGDYDIRGVKISPDDAVSSIASLISAVRMTDYPVYLLIDEYDNFANEVVMGINRSSEDTYERLVRKEGALKTVFKAVKSSTSHSLFDRIFITGVSPVVMSDITSGYNIAENIYLKPLFNDLCGFTHAETETSVRDTVRDCGLEEEKVSETLEMIRTWYNGYKFAPDADEAVYNPTLTLYFMKAFYETCKYPREMLDSNLAMDAGKLEYISRIPEGGQVLLNLIRENHQAVITRPSDRFGIREMLTDESRDHAFMISFLYYFGVLTLYDITDEGEIALKVPNLVIRKLYAEKIQTMLLPDPRDRDEGITAAKQLYQKGDMRPLCGFVENRYFSVFHNRDCIWANELTVKTAFLTLLYNDILYIMDSESETDRRYADLTMIIRPDMRKYQILDILIEFKFVKLKEAGLSGEQARKLTQEELRSLPQMVREMENARIQVKDYGEILEKRHGNLRLRKYAVVSLGFERIWGEEINGEG